MRTCAPGLGVLGPYAPVLLSAVVGCGGILGADRYEAVPADDGAGARSEGPTYTSALSGFTYADPVCGRCVDARCADPMRACGADSTCELYLACLAACTEGEACPYRCAVQIINGFFHTAPAVPEVVTCIDTRCGTECGLSVRDARGESCGVSSAPPACARCCCDELRACLDSPSCARSLDCAPCDRASALDDRELLSADVDTCFLECVGEARADDAAWLTTREALLACQRSSACAAACTRPTDEWSCVDRAQWAKPSHVPIVTRIGIAEYPNGRGLLPGVLVEQCSPIGDCTAPVAALTDDRGIATFASEPLRITGVVNYYYRFPSIAGDDFPPTVVMPYFPIAQSFVHTSFALRRSTLESFAHNQSLTMHPELGTIAFAALDCGVLPFDHTVLFVRLADPQPEAEVFGLLGVGVASGLTDSGGVVFNVQPGAVMLEYGFADRPDVVIGSTPAIVRAGEVTIVALVPTPR